MPAKASDEAQSTTTSTDPRIGSVLADRYRLNELVGEGGMGKVYAAEHVHMRKKLAVKVLHRELTTVPEVVARFEREAMAAANIDHPNVAAATDFGKLGDGAVFLVLEYVQGKNLRDEVALGPFAVNRALHVARQIAFALGTAHAQGIVHRDLKPENVMLIDKGGDPDFVKVLDFGIAKVPIGEASASSGKGHVITKAGMVFGTPEYMAPEQALGQPVDGRADLYALGVILFEMITGQRPYSGDDKVSILGLQLSKPPPKLRERSHMIDVPQAVEAIVEKLLSKDVAQRFQKAEDVAAAIEAVIGPPRSMQASSPGVGLTPPPHIGKPTFLPNDPLPRFPSAHTLPRVDGLGGVLKDLEGTPAVLPIKSDVDGNAHTRLAIDADLSSSPLSSKPVASERAKALALTARQSVSTAFARAVTFVDSSRDRWPAALRKKLSRVTGETIVVSGMSLVAVALFVTVLGVATGGKTEPAAAAAAALEGSPSASAVAVEGEGKEPKRAALEQAKAGGVPALDELAKRYPESAEAQLELADGLTNAKQYLKAVGAVSRALSLDAKKVEADSRASRVLFQSAQAKEAQDASFALLEGPMAARGADIVYDLAVDRNVQKATQKRAESWIKGADLPKVASPALAVAVAVRKSRSCTEVKSHLAKVKEVGDQRSLVYLEFFERKPEQYGCLTEGGLLTETMAAVRARGGSTTGDAGL